MFDRYIDIFDGGPTVTARTDDIRTIREVAGRKVAEIGDGGPPKMLVAPGRLKDFRACCASVKKLAAKGVQIDPEAAELLEIEVGDTVTMVAPVSLREINFDGIVGPSHNYAGPELRQRRVDAHMPAQVSQPRAAALAGPRKDARQPGARAGAGHLPAASAARPRVAGRARRRRSNARSRALAANAMSASAMWAANAATVSPAPGHGRRQVPPDRRESADHAAPQP